MFVLTINGKPVAQSDSLSNLRKHAEGHTTGGIRWWDSLCGRSYNTDTEFRIYPVKKV